MRREGKRFRTSHLEVRSLASLQRHPRVGIIVPRHRHTAVDRNRVKRRLRELVRTELWAQLLSRSPMDVVVWASPAAYDATFESLGGDLQRFVARLAPPAA